ncbi:hypothetical protein M0R45_010063 [Rubus argutus]|uniref:Uncharacterized protein n=1 Tax=Rubus argutus TaxID=59490 RepID=A0AAW1Y699_RUBAR
MATNSSPSNSNTTIPVVATLPAYEIPPLAQDGSHCLTRKPISLWPGMFHSPVTQVLWEARSQMFKRLFLVPPIDAPPQSELLEKTPSQSRTTILYNFSTDFILREQYRDPWCFGWNHFCKDFCPAPCTVDWPSLRMLLLIWCLRMKTFVPSFEAIESLPTTFQ